MILRHLHDDEEDAEAVRVLSAHAFGYSHRLEEAPLREPTQREIAREHSTVMHFARTDPGGCWLALDDDGTPAGAAISSRREGTWGLSLLAVMPPAQGKGVGRELLAAAMLYGRACLRGIICGSRDPRAAATYRLAGFTLHPAMRLHGTVDKAALAPPDGAVHKGTAKHRDMMDSVDRRTRGGAHGPDHEELLHHFNLLVVDDLAGSGYCYVHDDGRVEMLAATSRRLARRLLTAALLGLPEGTEVRVGDLTAEQEWAVDVGLAAGLEVSNSGYVCLRGLRPPNPYIPSGSFL
jgi:GNAT superfamily N-acetyltransferase